MSTEVRDSLNFRQPIQLDGAVGASEDILISRGPTLTNTWLGTAEIYSTALANTVHPLDF